MMKICSASSTFFHYYPGLDGRIFLIRTCPREDFDENWLILYWWDWVLGAPRVCTNTEQKRSKSGPGFRPLLSRIFDPFSRSNFDDILMIFWSVFMNFGPRFDQFRGIFWSIFMKFDGYFPNIFINFNNLDGYFWINLNLQMDQIKVIFMILDGNFRDLIQLKQKWNK